MLRPEIWQRESGVAAWRSRTGRKAAGRSAYLLAEGQICCTRKLGTTSSEAQGEGYSYPPTFGYSYSPTSTLFSRTCRILSPEHVLYPPELFEAIGVSKIIFCEELR